MDDAEIEKIRNLEYDKMNLPEKERRLFVLALKVHADPHSITDDDIAQVRKAGAADQEIVEIIEVMNYGNDINRFCDALGIGADTFLTYEMNDK